MREGGGRLGGGGEREAQEAESACSGFATLSPSVSVSHYLSENISGRASATTPVRCRCLPPSARKLRRRANGADMTTVVFSIQHAGAAKLEEIVVEVHPEWAPIGAQCVRPARTT